MPIETTRSMYCLLTGYSQDDSRKHVTMVTEDKSMVTTDGEETVTKAMRHGYSILTIYEDALEPYTNYPVTHTIKTQTIKHTGRKKRAQSR